MVPAVNQLEIHPYVQQREVHDFATGHGILNEAWSPRLTGSRPAGARGPQPQDVTLAAFGRAIPGA